MLFLVSVNDSSHNNSENASSGTMPVIRTGNNSATDDSADATWILTSAFIIFTMQSGFGLLEAGLVSRKNEANIMVKNAVDVIFGGLSYWLFGFAFSFGEGSLNNPFCGMGWFVTDADETEMGDIFSKYVFQLSFATTATTIVSGAMAERTNLKAYILYSFINTFTYCFPAHWMWGKGGWLLEMGAIDIAGCSVVHIVGGSSALVATIMLKPRRGKFSDGKESKTRMASPTNVLLGTFMLWWGWLGFNCGSTFGISGGKWKLASRAAVVTINASIGGGVFSTFYSYWKFKGKLDIATFVTGILGGLVGITAICVVVRPWESFLIGVIGGAIACLGVSLLVHFKIDDPVGAFSTHGLTGLWGMIAVGLFAEADNIEQMSLQKGVFKGGGWTLLLVQLLASLCIGIWAATATFLELYLVNKIFPLRMLPEEEDIGADFIEHGIEWIPDCSDDVDSTQSNDQSNVKSEAEVDTPGSCWQVPTLTRHRFSKGSVAPMPTKINNFIDGEEQSHSSHEANEENNIPINS